METPDDLTALEYCLQVVRKRQAEDSEYSWLWAIHAKVAFYCMSRLESASPKGPRKGAEKLTDTEKQFLLRNHPLLQQSQVSASSAASNETADWYALIRKRVERYISSLRGL